MLSDVIIRCAAVGVGGALGSIARYGLSLWGASAPDRVPWGTLAANVAGCLLMGATMQVLIARPTLPEHLRLLVAVGMLGGLTTFSTFSYEAFVMLRAGHVGLALSYMAASVALGLGAVTAGWAGARQILPAP